MQVKSVCVRAMAAVSLMFLALSKDARAATLDECIAAAMRNSPDVRAATERVQAARSSVSEAKSAYYPILGAAATYAKTDNPPNAFMMSLNQRKASLEKDFNNPADTDNLALSLGIKYRLLDFGRRGLDIDMAKGGADISGCFLKGLQNDLIHQVTRGYYTVLQASAFVSVQEESVKAFEESLRVANERLKAGETIKTDVLNLEVQLSQAKEDLIKARNGVKLSIAALNAAMGTNIVTGAELQAKVEKVESSKPELKDDAGAIQNRPELQAARLMANVQKMKARKAELDYLPTLSVFGSKDWNSDLTAGYEQSYMVGVAAEVDIFDGFRRKAAASGARANENAANAEVEKARNNLQLDLTSATLQLGEAWERWDVTRKNISTAEESLRITMERYKQGAASIPELLTAQVGLTGTRTRNIAALYDYLIAVSNLERAKGRLVETYIK